jgi:hypothetical protein
MVVLIFSAPTNVNGKRRQKIRRVFPCFFDSSMDARTQRIQVEKNADSCDLLDFSHSDV